MEHISVYMFLIMISKKRYNKNKFLKYYYRYSLWIYYRYFYMYKIIIYMRMSVKLYFVHYYMDVYNNASMFIYFKSQIHFICKLFYIMSKISRDIIKKYFRSFCFNVIILSSLFYPLMSS